MRYTRFAAFNVIGAVLWIISMTTLGYYAGRHRRWFGRHFEKVVILIIAVSLLPIVIEYSRRGEPKRPPSA